MICALILAGGEGRRLGGADKALTRLHGIPLLTCVIARLRDQTDAIAISTRGDGSRFAAFDCAVVDDGRHRGKGPLAGLHAGLVWAAAARGTALLSVPVDTPFIPADLARRLHPAPAVAACGDRVHHLVALWPVAAIAGKLDAFLDGPGPYRVADFARSLAMRRVDFDAVSDPFLNINTPEDLARAEARRC